MPNKSASFKSVRQTEKRHARNLAVKQAVRKVEKIARKAIVAKDKSAASAALLVAIKTIDRARQKGVLKLNTASRMKSRLHKSVAKL